MVFSHGLIKEFKAEGSEESLEAFQEAWPAIFQWLSKERPKEMNELMPNGAFVYSAESAIGWLSLLNEWQGTAISNKSK